MTGFTNSKRRCPVSDSCFCFEQIRFPLSKDMFPIRDVRPFPFPSWFSGNELERTSNKHLHLQWVFPFFSGIPKTGSIPNPRVPYRSLIAAANLTGLMILPWSKSPKWWVKGKHTPISDNDHDANPISDNGHDVNPMMLTP